ncbi:MAG TPA: hypothetical protein VKB69_01505 [Micromonosporaceae bacterium]|nr:hypothetical protein [Micromonosporaceae bacterium]
MADDVPSADDVPTADDVPAADDVPTEIEPVAGSADGTAAVAAPSATQDADKTGTAGGDAPASEGVASTLVNRAAGSGRTGSEHPATEITASDEAAEPLVLDDLTVGSDLKTKVSEAWHDFARALAKVVTQLPEQVHLDLTLDPTASGTGHAIYEVSVQHRPGGQLGVLAVGNAGLPEGQRLDRDAVAEMVILGWSPPGVIAGSGNDFGMSATMADAVRVAVVVTKTLRDVYRAPHPAFLTYSAFDEEDNSVTLGPLGAARVSSGDERIDSLRLSEAGFAALEDPSMSLQERVRIVVAGLQRTTPEAVPVDSDGDIGIRAGSAMIFVRVRDNPPLIDVFSPIITDVDPSEKLYAKLSDLTTKMPIGRLYQANRTVWASVPVFGRDFQATHLMLALQVMTGLADELDDRLHGEFGGRRFFGGDAEATAPPSRDDLNIGMYM